MSDALRRALEYVDESRAAAAQQPANLREAADAQDMWAPTRAYEAGRLATDINANNADIARLRANNRAQEADVLERQNQALAQRQALYAPDIEKVEDIGSKNGYLRDGLSWFGSQLGNAAASAQDPVALAAAGTAVGRAASVVPQLRGVGKAIQYGSQLGAFGVNQRQMTGEMYGRLRDDPAAFTNMTPQEAYRTSNLYGVGAGALESLLPGTVGHALGGGALRAGGRAALQRGAGATLLKDAATEGGTELAQQYAQQQVHSAYNPARSTLGDASELLNAGLGGAAGGVGLGAPHAIADAAYGRAARTGEVVREKAGETVDLLKDKAPQVYEDSGIKGVVDMGAEKARDAYEGVAGAFRKATDYLRDEQGRINYPEATRKAMADYDRYKMSQEEADTLTAVPPEGLDPEGTKAWAQENDVRRGELITNRLAALEKEGVQEASPLLDAITGDDPVAQFEALNQATEFLLQRNAAVQVDRKAAVLREFIGNKIQQAAHAVTRAAQKAAGAAVFTGMNVAEGVAQATGGPKRNAQGTQGESAPLTYDQWMAARAAAGRAFDAHGAKLRAQKRAATPAPAPEQVQAATTVGELFARAAAREDLGGDVRAREDYGRSLAYELSEMAQEYELRGFVRPSVFDALADDLRDTLGKDAQDAVTRMAALEGGSQLLTDMAAKVSNAALRARRPTQLQDQLIAQLPQEHQAEVRKSGAADLQEAVLDIARGRMPERRIKEIEKAIGGDTLRRMLEIVDGPDETFSARAQNEAPVFGEVPDAFEQRQGERRVASEAGAPAYSFARSGLQSAVTPTRLRPDPFAPGKDGRRPHLFDTTLAEDTAIGAPALQKKIDDTNALHAGVSGALHARAITLADVFKDLNYSQQQQLALFRDYMVQEGRDDRAATLQQMLGGTLQDARVQRQVLAGLARFAKERSVVVTEQGTQRMPTEMAHGTLVSMGKAGDKAMSLGMEQAAKAGKRGSAEFKAALARQMAGENLLTFQTAEGKNTMGRKGGNKDITLSADRLVKWVRARPGYEGDDGRPAHERYLSDLLEGIQSVMGSGYAANELPTMTSADGKVHSFADGLPPNLRLGLRSVSSLQAEGKTVAELEKERAQWLSAIPTAGVSDMRQRDARRDARHQELVAKDQDKDYFAPRDDDGNEARSPRERFKTVVTRDDKRTERDQFVPADENEDKKTPLDVTQDKRFGNAKTEREDLADRTTRKAVDIGDGRDHAVAQKAREAALARRVVELVSGEDYSDLDTAAKVDAFIAATRDALEHLDKKELAGTLTAKEAVARERLSEMLGPKSTFDWASLYPSWDGDSAPFDARVNKALGRDAAPEVAAAGAPKSQSAPAGAQQPKSAVARAAQGRKLSLLSTQVHNDLRRPGFAATHDSPIRHDGKFDWRGHTGKGEGAAAFGAGTYLSTGDKVHAFYKKMMMRKLRDEAYLNDPVIRRLSSEFRKLREEHRGATAVSKAAIAKQMHELSKQLMTRGEELTTKSPTYHVSVQAMKAQLLNWDKPLNEQSSYVKKRLEGELRWTNQKRWSGETSINLTVGTTAFGKPIWAPDDNPTGRYLVASNPLDRHGDTFGTLEEAKKFVAEEATAGSLSGEYIYKGLTQRLGSQEAASDYLQSLGILGHEYAAANGRDGKTPNYVIYDDSKIVTNFVSFNKQGAGKFEGWKTGPTARQGSGVAPDADVAAARAYVDKVLGPQVKAVFENITGYSGEWIEAENLIKVSTLTNAGVMNVARHEALHAFYSRFVKANPKAQRVLASLTDDPRVLRRLEALLKDEPEAFGQLTDGEERLAYIHQFAQAGLLKLPHTPGTTLMAKVRKFLRRVFQMVSDQERAVDLLYSFERGDFRGLEPSAAGRVIARSIDQGTWLKNGAKAFDKVMQAAAALTVPAHTILQNSASPTARKIAELFYTNPADEAAGDKEPGYLNERNQQMRRYSNLFRNAVGELDEGQRRELLEAMQNETPTASLRDPDVQDAKEKLHAMFSRFHRYLTDEKGLRIGKINENYFPVVYDAEKVRDGSFAKMLREKYASNIAEMVERINAAREKDGKAGVPVSADDVIEAVVQRIAGENPMDDTTLDPLREDGVLRPWFAGGEKRTLNFLKPEDRAPFLEKDLVRTLSQYVRQGVRAAEYSSRFGRQGALLSKQLEAVKQELQDAAAKMLKEGDLKDEKARDKWGSRQYRDVANAVGAMEGSLGHDVPEWVRKTNSAAIVYQNVRILPLALFSSFVDPLGIIARGGEMRDAFNTFARGMRDVARTWGDMMREEPKQRQKDEWEKLAEHVGVIDAAVFNHFLHDEYASVYLDGRAKKINEVMFKANGMEPFNRAMRVGATQSAVKFIERHSKKPEAHSARWMAELGFDKASPHFDVDGRLITDKNVLMEQNPGMSQEQAEAEIARTHRAINRWVEGAILSPNAAQRPAWASDPHYSMFWHLKQFAYSFHQTIMKRAVSEAKHGNVLPLGVFAWYIPTMIAADVAKGMMLGAGELPNYMKGYDLGDWVAHGVNRAGVLGVGDIGVNAAREPLGLAGPMVEQISDIFTEPLEKNIMHALPANALYSRALN